MIDRGFNEVDLRQMIEEAISYRKSAAVGRFVIQSRYNGDNWEVVVEPDFLATQLLVITAYVRDQS